MHRRACGGSGHSFQDRDEDGCSGQSPSATGWAHRRDRKRGQRLQWRRTVPVRQRPAAVHRYTRSVHRAGTGTWNRNSRQWCRDRYSEGRALYSRRSAPDKARRRRCRWDDRIPRFFFAAAHLSAAGSAEGLLGELMIIACVLGVSIASTAAILIWKSGTSGGTTLKTAPADSTKGLYSGKYGAIARISA